MNHARSCVPYKAQLLQNYQSLLGRCGSQSILAVYHRNLLGKALSAAMMTVRLIGSVGHEVCGDGARTEEGKHEQEAVEEDDGGDDVEAQTMVDHGRADSNESVAADGDGNDEMVVVVAAVDSDENERKVVTGTCRRELFSPSIPGHYSQQNNYPHNTEPEPLSCACSFPWRAGHPHNLAFFA